MSRRLLILAVVAATPLCAQEAAPPGDAVAGAALYDEACARCHRDVADLVARLDPDPAVAGPALADKLSRHHADDPAMQADIIAYLLGLE